MFSKFKIREMKNKFDAVNVADIADSKLQAKAKRLKMKQGGFTLLELLVVVAILAAIAGTATIALQDTDARASAAAHVAMMDELNKGIRTYRVLNKNTLPNNFDSLIQTDDIAGANPAAYSNLEIADVQPVVVPLTIADTGDTNTDDSEGILGDIGMTQLQYIALNLDPADGGTCADTADLINRRDNAVVPGNIFLTPAGNGCGYAADLVGGGTQEIMVWTGGSERITGQPGLDNNDVAEVLYDGSNLGTATGKAFMAVGIGPASTLFNANNLGGMTSVPVYRHVSAEKYNRFIALFDIGSFDDSTGTPSATVVPKDQVSFAGVVDGAGDTKEEELGEWDGQRNTI